MTRFLRHLVLALALAASLHAAEAVGTLELKGGRVLHNAKILSDQWDSVVVYSTEGMVKVKKSDLPPALQAKYPMKEAPPPPMVSPKVTINEPPQKRVAPPPAPPKDDAKSNNTGIYQGLMILNFHPEPMQATQGCVSVTIHNTGSDPVKITPDMIVCVKADGGQYVGKRFFSIVDQGTMVKTTDSVAPSADVTEIVFFQNDPLDMQDIRWAR